MKEGSPFNCEKCSDEDKAQRNCLNPLELSEDARAVEEYTDEVKDELKEKGAKKVFMVGDIRLYECPLSLITIDTREIMRLCYLVDASKSLLYSGGWGDQPMWFVEAFEIFNIENARKVNNGSPRT